MRKTGIFMVQCEARVDFFSPQILKDTQVHHGPLMGNADDTDDTDSHRFIK